MTGGAGRAGACWWPVRARPVAIRRRETASWHRRLSERVLGAPLGREGGVHHEVVVAPAEYESVKLMYPYQKAQQTLASSP